MAPDPASLRPTITPPAEANPRTDPPLDFPDAAYGELTRGDYEALGFLAGLEVHQQLLTKSKLFCRCPAGRYVERFDAEVLRHMRPTLSELGEYDGTALMEFKTRKQIVYQLERGSVCTYEMDDTPPFAMDEEAIRIALEVAQLLKLNLVSELHVMRKQYLDGSIPTGFQRTAMVGLDGAVPFVVPALGVNRALRIRQLSLEEDSCREVSDVGHEITFRTDRLGMPLIETVTQPELVTPLELQAAGRLLAEVAATTRKIRRGPGAARQDVNVSVAGGRRVEIKGVDHHRGLPLLVHIEAFRQLNLLRIREEARRRGVTAALLRVPDTGLPWEESSLVVDAAPALRTCQYDPIRAGLDRGDSVCALRLTGFAGLLSRRTQPGITFAQELSERVRVIACPSHRPFMVHSDVGDAALPARVWRQLRRQLRAGVGDAVVVIWAPEPDAATAAREVLLRAQEALVGIPAETRQAHADGTTGFERILPGPDRMYPDTDTPPIPLPDELLETVRADLPESPWARAQRYRRMGLSRAAARELACSSWVHLFDAGGPTKPETARRLATALQKRVPYHVRTGRDEPPEAGPRLRQVVAAVEAGAVRVEAMDRLVDRLFEQSSATAEETIAPFRSRPDDLEQLRRSLNDLTERGTAFQGRDAATVLRWAMGEIMPKFIGRLEPTVVRRRIAEALRVPEAAA